MRLNNAPSDIPIAIKGVLSSLLTDFHIHIEGHKDLILIHSVFVAPPHITNPLVILQN